MGLISKLSGRNTNKSGDAFCFVFGSDKRFFRRTMASQGSHIQDNVNRMAYFSSPDTNGVLSRKVNGVERTLGPVNVAYELIPELYRFAYLDWAHGRDKQAGQGSDGRQNIYEPDEILDNSWAEGFSLAAQKQEDVAVRDRLLQILLLAVLGTVAMFLLVAASTGLLSDFVSGASKFFGG